MTSICFSLVFATLISSSCMAGSSFPRGPDARLTPGSYCTRPDQERYPEKIPYCERDVSSQRKRQVIQDYNQKLGFNIRPADRQQFKIDHLIPLCAGGSNEDSNLWPQHRSIYQITDGLEGKICEKMSLGKLRQAYAVELLLRAKNDLDQAAEIEDVVDAL